MRLELALIVGILFFCCWCAYIIVRMNSSVTGPPNELARPEDHQLQAALASNQTLSSHYHHLQSPISFNGQRLASGSGDYQQVSSAVPYYYAAGNQLAPVMWPGAGQQQAPSQSVDGYTANKWPPQSEYRQVVRHQQQHVEAPSYVAAPSDQLEQQRHLIEAANSGSVAPDQVVAEEQPGEEAADESQATDEAEPQAEASDGTEEQEPEQGVSAGEAGEPEGEGQEADETEAEAEEQTPEEELGLDMPVNSELVERVGQRSFDENDSESNERDKDGVIIKEHHRHLLNGKPVRSRRDQARAAEKLAKSREFDSIVDEIEGDDNAVEKTEGQTDEEAAGVGLQAQATDRRMDDPGDMGKRRRINSTDFTAKVAPMRPGKTKAGSGKPKDSHRHQLYETLSAQKWDDDDDNESGANQTTNSKTMNPSAENAETIIGFEDLDLLLDKGTSTPHSRRRRKRQVVNGTDTIVVRLASNNNGTTLSGSPGLVRLNGTEGSGNFTSANSTRGRTGQPPDPVSGAEDMSIEVMSNPLQKPADIYATIGPPAQVAQSRPSTPIHLNGHGGYAFGDHDGKLRTKAQRFVGSREPGRYGSLGPYAPSSPLASGSKKVKKKKKAGTMKKSKLYESKFDAAKAQAMKNRSKFKKGSMKAKKHKAKKKLVHNHKAFSGATKGKKSAKGKANKGAKKGMLYYKDKGYKKRGFKKAYQKVEAGDHKTYFDEYRDKDHNKKWKNFKDGHHYSQHKHWAGKDKKFHKDYKLGSMKHKNSKSGAWKEKKASKYKKDYKQKLKSAKKSAKKSSKSSAKKSLKSY